MPTPVSGAAAAPASWPRSLRRGVAIGLGAVLVAIAAQVTVPLPGGVPMTLSPLAVLVVGGVLGPAAGAAALVAYLLAGMAGLPVFAGGAGGALRLLGPTGGYLLAFPVAAAAVGWLARGGWARALVACAAGMIVIHAGGVAQLWLLAGNAEIAVRLGSAPFWLGDVVKVALAAAIVAVAAPPVRARL